MVNILWETRKCYRKERHETFAQAVEQWKEVYTHNRDVKRHALVDLDRLVIYPCGVVEDLHWHVGHLKKGQGVE